MTHNNLSVLNLWDKRDWIRVLNWRPQQSRKRLRVALPVFGGLAVAEALRVKPEDAERLRTWINKWIDAKRNASKLFDHARANRYCLPGKDCARIGRKLRSIQGSLHFSTDGSLSPQWTDCQTHHAEDPAAELFIRIMADEDRWRLAGPCIECRDYFLRERRRQVEKRFCPRCRHYEAKPRMRALREKQHSAILRIARQSIRDWEKSQTSRDWKPWVMKRANRIIRQNRMKVNSVTIKALTRWVNAGELKISAGAKTHRKGEN